MANTKQTLLIKVAAQHPAPAFLSDLCTARAMTKIARMAAIQGFTEDYLMNKKADLNDYLGKAWQGVQDWWADDNNKAGLIGGGLGALGTYGLTGLVPGLRGNTAARLGLSGLAGVGGWYGGRYGAQQLMDKYLNKGKEEAFGPAFQQGLEQASNEAADTAKEVSAQNAAEKKDLQNQITALTGKLNAQQQANKDQQAADAEQARLLAGYIGRREDTAEPINSYNRAIDQQQVANRDSQIKDLHDLLNSTDRYQDALQKQLGEAYDQQDALTAQLNAAGNTLTAEQARAYAAQQAADKRIADQQYDLKRQLIENEMAGANTEALQQELANLYDNPQIAAILNPPKPVEPKPNMVAAGGANSGLQEQSAANAVKPEFLPEVKIDRLTDSYIKAMNPSVVDRLTQSKQTVQEKQLNAATAIIDMYNKARVSDPAMAQQLAPYATQARDLRRKLLGLSK